MATRRRVPHHTRLKVGLILSGGKPVLSLLANARRTGISDTVPASVCGARSYTSFADTESLHFVWAELAHGLDLGSGVAT